MNDRSKRTGQRLLVLALTFLALSCNLMAQSLKHLTHSEAVSAATSKPQPEYPPMAKQLKLEGSVEFEVYISEDGSVERVETASGNPMLAKPVEKTLKEWKFTPFKEDGKPVKAVATLRFNFKR